MPEYILRPRSYNYVDGYKYDDENHPTEHCMDDDLDTYWAVSDYHNRIARTLYDFDFSQIPNNEVITNVIISVKYYNSHTIDIEFIPVSELEKGVSSTTNKIGEKVCTLGFTSSVTTKDYSLFDKTFDETAVSGVVKYLNDYKNQLINGNKIFGLLYHSMAPSEKQHVRFYDIALKITTEIMGSLIYNADNNITSAYLGNQSVSAIYIGDKKLL